MIVFLDTRPLAMLTNPKLPPSTVAILRWARDMRAAGHSFVVPAIADYEVRRELERAGKVASIAELNTWRGEYLPLTDSALQLAAKLWAQSRNAGTPTADPKELDGDVLIAAQALDMGLPASDFTVATSNPNHLFVFVPCDEWQDIKP
ncbi:MAG: type II toxin-antitoxin system VapC family toxin [Capsulimonadaceae bacterium]